MQKQFEESCWEKWLRLVIHILLRSLGVANIPKHHFSFTKQNINSNLNHRLSHSYNNPMIIENLTLPCLRIITSFCKWTTNVSYLTNLITTTKSRKSNIQNSVNNFIHQTLYQMRLILNMRKS